MTTDQNDTLAIIEEAQRLVDLHRKPYGIFNEGGKLVTRKIKNEYFDDPKLLEIIRPTTF